jgi:hypothetical protein
MTPAASSVETPVDPRLAASLGRVSRRLMVHAALRGATYGLVVGIVGLVVWVLAQPLRLQGSLPGGAGSAAACVLGAMVLGMALSVHARLEVRRGHGGSLPDAARRVEKAIPASRNVVLTAAEFPGVRLPVNPSVRDAIVADAAALLGPHSPRSLVPLHAAGFSLAAVAVVAAGLLFVIAAQDGVRAFPSGFPPSLAGGPAGAAGAGIQGGMDVVVRITPPAYSGDSVRAYRNPDRVEALRGSRLDVAVRVQEGPSGGSVILETLDGRRDLLRSGSGEYLGEITVEADGFLVLERRGPISTAAAGQPDSSRRLIGVGAIPDPAPTVRISAPGQDLYFPDGDRTIDLEVEATDDRAIRSLELLFTTVSGFGELFEFREGSIPLEVDRHDAGRWTARARWDLAGLELDRGDVVV